MKEIVLKCHKFYKLSSDIRVSKVSLIDNDDPLLLELSHAKNFQDRIDIALKDLKKLGEGSSRCVFKLPDGNVLKLASNDKGIAQNLAEARPQAQRLCTNRVLLADPDGKWLVVKFAKKINKKRFEDLIGIGFDDFTKALYYKFNNESDDYKLPANYNDIINNKLFQSVAQLVLECDLQVGDIDKIDSWVETEDGPVIGDYGLSKKIWEEYYAD